LIRAGTFREDFYYRINVIEIRIPPLRDRKGDIPLLVQHFLTKYSRETTKHVDHTDEAAEKLLKAYDWPGNVRELENAIERAVVLSKARTLTGRDFSFLKTAPPKEITDRSLLDLEKRHIRNVLDECGWNVSQAAKILDINRSTLHKKINKYGLRK